VWEFETLEQLLPARWNLSVNLENRPAGLGNMPNSEQMSVYVSAVLDNSTGLVNNSPRIPSFAPINLHSNQLQHYSLNAFDGEGDSLVYRLVAPLATSTPTTACGAPTPGTIAPHFQLNAATGELTAQPALVQQGRYALAVRVDEYRSQGGSWQLIGHIMRDIVYLAWTTGNQAPTFTRVAYANAPTGQLLGQALRVNPGQTVALQVTAADPDAGQVPVLSSETAGIVPGVSFQGQANGQGLLTWQVPASMPVGRYFLSVLATDNLCRGPGTTELMIPFDVTRQALAARPRQQLAQSPYPTPFSHEVRFQLHGQGAQAVLVVDELGRTVARLTSSPDGRVVWRPAPGMAAGLYLARTLSGTQVARLAYAGR
jgi:hypothetical protein